MVSLLTPQYSCKPPLLLCLLACLIILRHIESMENKILLSSRCFFYLMFANRARAKNNVGWRESFLPQKVQKNQKIQKAEKPKKPKETQKTEKKQKSQTCQKCHKKPKRQKKPKKAKARNAKSAKISEIAEIAKVAEIAKIAEIAEIAETEIVSPLETSKRSKIGYFREKEMSFSKKGRIFTQNL